MNPLSSSTSNSSVSTKALRQLFQWMERKYGGIIPMEPINSLGREIIVVDNNKNNNSVHDGHTNILQSRHLLRLMQHDALAIHVKEFYPKHTAVQIAQDIIHEMQSMSSSNSNSNKKRYQNWQVSSSRGLESSDVSTIGEYSPYNIVVGATNRNNSNNTNNDAIEEYLNGVQREHIRRRYKYNANSNSIKEPFLWPLDLLRLQLDEAWPMGAGLARHTTTTGTDNNNNNGCSSRPYGGGLPRIMIGPTKYKHGFIHVDDINPMSKQNGLFSANIYLQLPPTETLSNSVSESERTSNDTNNISATTTTNNNNNNNNVLEIWPTRIMSRWDWYRNGYTLSNLSSQNINGQIALRHAFAESARSLINTTNTVSTTNNNTTTADMTSTQQHTTPSSITSSTTNTNASSSSGGIQIPNIEVGDLVLFCVQRPHAAIGFQHGIRVSLQCFIQYQGLQQRLLIDS